MNKLQKDLVIIGGGPGGYVAALRAVQGGLSTILIEKEKIGGMCLNWGCIPSKSIQTSAKLYERVLEAEKFGLTGVNFSNVKPDWLLMNERANQIVNRLTKGVETLLNKNGVETIIGEGTVLEPNRVKVNDSEIECKDLIIATGSHYLLPDILQNTNNVYTPRTIYSIQKLPGSLLIIGAGVIGIEFAMLFSSLGVKVSIIDKSDKIMPYLDNDIMNVLKTTLRKSKVDIMLGYDIVELTDEGMKIKNKNEEKLIKTDIYLSAISRQGNFTGLDSLIEKRLDTYGSFIKTDLRARTSIPHVYAIGDVNGVAMLAHVASAEGTTAVNTILGVGKDLIYEMMPYNLYGKLEFASVGLTEQAALERGFIVESGKFPLIANGKALAEGNAEGLVKIVYDKKYGEILGVHIAADNATDLISESVMAMQLESTVWDVATAVHPHPTMSEAFLEAIYKGIDKPLHTL